MFLSAATATENVTPEELRSLISDAQDVSVTVWVDDAGEERVTYGTTFASEVALDRLATAFLPLMRKVVKANSRRMDADDALGIVQAEFVQAVRRHDLAAELDGSGRSFRAGIETTLRNVVADAAASQRGIVSVPDSTAHRFYQLLSKHDGDFSAAYTECLTTTNGFEPHTFLAVHAALVSSDNSLDTPRTGEFDADNGTFAQYGPDIQIADLAPDSSPEDSVVTVELVRWLFSLTSDRQESILRLIFGFQDVATESVRSDHGFRPGECLSDREVSGVIGGGVSTVSRQKREALALMRTALVASMADAA